MLTGLGNNLCSSYIVLALKPKRSRIISSGVKLLNVSCLEISIIDASVEKSGLIQYG